MKKIIMGIFACLLVISFIRADIHEQEKLDNKENIATLSALTQKVGHFPLYFIPNNGQQNEKVRYYSKTPGYTLWMTKNGLTFDSVKKVQEKRKFDSVIKDAEDNIFNSKNQKKYERDTYTLKFNKANPNTKIISFGITDYRVSYFTGNDPSKWAAGIQASDSVLYDDLYPGIDLKVYGIQEKIEYDFIVSPGKNPDIIQFTFQGAKNAELANDGNIIVRNHFGEITHKKPVAYQIIDDKKIFIEVDFTHIEGDTFGFTVSEYDSIHPLIIDPVVSLQYSSYLGGNGDEGGYGIAVDSNGCGYISGHTTSTDFPVSNAYQNSYQGNQDVFITKFSQDGSSLEYSTYLGGTAEDGGYNEGMGIVVDDSGYVYLTGYTLSSDFPTIHAFQSTLRGSSDAFVTKLTQNGQNLEYSSYFGGTNWENGNDIALDSLGNVYLVGRTGSSDFPTYNPYQPAVNGSGDIFVTKFASDLSSLVYSTYLGGSSHADLGYGIAVDMNRCAYVSGWTQSADFPMVNAYDSSLGGDYDAFLTKFSSTGSSLVFSTYLGGSGMDFNVGGLTVDGLGRAHLVGWTGSTDFPLVNAYQTIRRGSYDAFITIFDANGSTLSGSSYFGGSGTEAGNGIALDSSGNIYIIGSTTSSDLPTLYSLQSTLDGSRDAFITKFTSTSSLGYSTYLGGSSGDQGIDIRIDSNGWAYSTGFTGSSNFPIVSGYQPSFGGGNTDAFFSVLRLCSEVGSFNLISPSNGAVDQSIDIDLNWGNASNADSYDVYFGTTSPPPLVENVTDSFYDPGNLSYDQTYYWKVVARNICSSLSSPEWYFTTIHPPTIVVEGNVANGGSGLSGVSMTGLPAVPVTSGTGFYTDTVDYGWSGTVTPVLTGYSFTPAMRTYSNETADQTGQDYTAALMSNIVSGTVNEGGSGVSGVTMNGLPANPVTDTSGSYTGNVIMGWSGSVTPTASGYSFTPEYRTYSSVTSNQTNQDYTALSDSDVYAISGTVLTYFIAPERDVVMNGLPGSPKTDNNGYYIGTVGSGWSGTVVPVKPAFIFSPDSRSYTNVQSDQTSQDYGAAEGYTYHYISGSVALSDGTPIVNVLISGLPGDPYTDGAGDYIAAVDDGWSGTAVPVKVGYTFSPNSRSYSSVSGDQADEDYTGTEASYAISGTVTHNSGGLENVLLQGLPGDPTTLGDGTYSTQVGHGWSGVAEPVKTAYSFTPDSRSYSDVTADQTGQNYTAEALVLITGTITAGGSALNGVVMNGLPNVPATVSSGDYTDYVPENWSGVVVPAASGYVFTPESRSYIAVTTDQTDQDYTATADTDVFSISGTVDDGTNPLAGVVLNGLPVNPATNESGFYLDTVPTGWSGTVTPAMSGYAFTPASRSYTSLAADQADQDYSGAVDANIIAISGRVTMADGTMLTGVELDGLPNSPLTNPSGYYIDTVDTSVTFSGWSGSVTPKHDAYTFTPADRTYTGVTTDQTDQDYTAALKTYTVSGTVTFDGSGLADVTMTGLPAEPLTVGSGFYSDTVEHGWGGTVAPEKTGYVFSPTQNIYPNVTEDIENDYTAALQTHTISGTVTAGGSGLQGVTITGLPENPVTLGDGTYSGSVEYGWSGAAVPVLAGYTFTPDSRSYSNVTADQSGEDYAASGGADNYSISGTVDDGTSGLANVVMNGLPHTVATASDGTYYDTVRNGWTGVVTPVLSGYTFTPESRSYSDVTANQSEQNYTGTDNGGSTVTVSGNVNDGSEGMEGVVLNGLPGNPETAPDGDYTGSVDSGWSGVVTPAASGYTFTPGFRSYSSISSDQTGQDYVSTSNIEVFSISGTISDGANGIEGVVLNGLPVNPATNASGYYIDTVSISWSGTVTPTAAGYVFDPGSRAYINVSFDQENQDYTATADATVIGISGHVDDGTDPLAGVVLNGLPINPATNPAGYYIDTVSSGWSGTVIPTAAGYTFTPSDTAYSNVTTDQADQDYTATADSSILSISGHVTESGGSMIAGVEIGGLPNTPSTNPSGYYIDTVSTGWSGTITPAHADYDFTPADASFTSISTDQTQDFTAEAADVTISGTVTESGSGLADVVMNGLPGNPQTLGDGTYSGTVEIGWSGVVTPTLSGYIFTPETRSYSSVDTGQSGEDYTATPDSTVYTISGTVTESSTGLEGVVMNGLPGTVTTAADGTYSDSVDEGWSGVVTPALSGYDFTPESRSYSSVSADQTAQDYTAADNGGTTFTVSGNVNDGTDGIADVAMNGLPGGIMTGPAGDYTGTVDSGWSGVVTPAASGWAFTPESRSYSSVSADQTDQDYTGSASGTTYSISGNVNDGTNGVGNVVMNGLPGNPVTGPAGDYTGPVSDGWSGAVTPAAAGYAFTPDNRSYSAVSSDQTDQDYTAAADADMLEISGHADDGANPVPGVVLNGLPNVPETNAAGDYMDTVESGWSGTVTPALSGYVFTPEFIDYSNVTTDQLDQDYTAAADASVLSVSGTVTENGTGLAEVVLTGLPAEPATDAAGDYTDTVDSGWSGTVTPVLSGYSFEPENRTYSSVAGDQTDQDYTASAGYYSSPSNYQVIPEVLWAPATGGGTWMTEVQITDVTGGSEVSVYFNSATGDRRGPIDLFTGSGPDTSVKAGNLLNTLGQLDTGFDYYSQVGAVEFMTQDADHKIHVIARTKNGNFSKTFPGLNHNDDNTAGGTRTMMIQNLANNDTYRTAYGAFNPTDESITVEYELFDSSGNTIGTTFTKTFTGRQYQAVSVFSEAGVPYPTYSYENVWLKITPASGSGELMSYGATANNVTNDPAVHTAAQAQDIDGYNAPSEYQVIPEVLWAPATGGGTWMTEVQITDITGGSDVSVYFNASTGERRGPIDLFTGSGAGVSARTANLLATLDALDTGFDYYATVGTVEFVTQDTDHNIQVIARTANGNYSKTFQGLNLNDANTASTERTLMVQNLVNDDNYRTAFGAFNPTDDDVTVEFTLIDEAGNAIGSTFAKTFTGRQYQAFNPFTEAGVPYPSYTYDNTWIKVEVASGSGQLMVYGATANNITSDPAVHRAVQH